MDNARIREICAHVEYDSARRMYRCGKKSECAYKHIYNWEYPCCTNPEIGRTLNEVQETRREDIPSRKTPIQYLWQRIVNFLN